MTDSAMAKGNVWAIRFGSFGVPLAHAAGQNVVTVLGLRFLTDNTGMAAGTAGLIFALVKIYDGLLDPAVGAWSDNARTRWGRRLTIYHAETHAFICSVDEVLAPDTQLWPLRLKP